MQILSLDDGTWNDLLKNWKSQCDEEDFEIFQDGIFKVLSDLVESPEDGAAVLSSSLGEETPIICQVNTKKIKGYKGPVLRVRHLLLSPYYDLNDVTNVQYGKVIVNMFNAIVEISDNHPKLKAKHIKFHLRSSTDQQFFTAIGDGLRRSEKFKTVQSKGAWLYVTKQ